MRTSIDAAIAIATAGTSQTSEMFQRRAADDARLRQVAARLGRRRARRTGASGESSIVGSASRQIRRGSKAQVASSVRTTTAANESRPEAGARRSRAGRSAPSRRAGRRRRRRASTSGRRSRSADRGARARGGARPASGAPSRRAAPRTAIFSTGTAMLAMKTIIARPHEPSSQSSWMPPSRVCSSRCSAEVVTITGRALAGT